MNIKHVELLPGAQNARISPNSSDAQTIIAFECNIWPGRECVHIVPERWELKAVNNNMVTLFNHNEIIKEND